MANSNFPMDWSEFEKQMLKQFSFLPKDFIRGDKSQNTAWVNEYVKKQVDRFLNESVTPNIFNPFASGILNYDLFETHRSIIVRLQVPNNISPYDVRTSINRRKVRLELPSGKQQEIRLDKPVNPKRSRAVIKDGILEIRMPKIHEAQSYHEVYAEE